MTVRMFMPSLRDHTILAHRGRTILAPSQNALLDITPQAYVDCIEREAIDAPEMAGDSMSRWQGIRRPGQDYITVATAMVTRHPPNHTPTLYYRAVLTWVTVDAANDFMRNIVNSNLHELHEVEMEFRERTSTQYNHRGERIEVRRPMGNDAPLRLTEISLVNPLVVPAGTDVGDLREQLERLLAQRIGVTPELLRGADLNAAESAIVGHHRSKALEEMRQRIVATLNEPSEPKTEIDFNKRVIRRRRD